jgi:hypothetical protein
MIDREIERTLRGFGLSVVHAPNFKGLHRMIKGYVDWVDLGAPDHPVYKRHFTIIEQSIFWDQNHNDGEPCTEKAIREYWFERFTKFWPVQQNPENPFDADFQKEHEQSTAYLNEKRLEWLRNYLYPSCFASMREQYEERRKLASNFK